jgi:hypothetical protein
MITLTYGIGGLFLIAAATAFVLDLLSAWIQTFAWMGDFLARVGRRKLRLLDRY